MLMSMSMLMLMLMPMLILLIMRGRRRPGPPGVSRGLGSVWVSVGRVCVCRCGAVVAYSRVGSQDTRVGVVSPVRRGGGGGDGHLDAYSRVQ